MIAKRLLPLLFMLMLLLCPSLAFAEGGLHLDGAELGGWWTIPFIGMLLSIALCPLLAEHFWHHNFGKVAVFWSLVFLAPFTIMHGFSMALYEMLHTLLLEYIPFILLLLALFTVAGGIRLKGTLVGTPAVNLLILVIGTFLSSWMGTTGSAMLLIRPVLRANAHRKYRVHTIVFFIFLVANAGGSLTPLGDPPLFLGFLKGVDFFWTAAHMLPLMIALCVPLLAIYFIVDTILYAREGKPVPPNSDSGEKLGLEGAQNFILLACVVGVVLFSGMAKLGDLVIYHIEVAYADVIRDIALVIITVVSLKITNRESRVKNDFTWAPIAEVAKLFAGIFVTMVPAIAILRAGAEGALAPVIRLVTNQAGEPVNSMFFWLTGVLSSFLDNAPTYLVFFNTAGGDAAHLMHDLAPTLLAISAGAVFMGANTYIGNAPNFMVRSIAIEQGVKMPSFFGYMAWSIGILVPLFIILTFVFF